MRTTRRRSTVGAGRLNSHGLAARVAAVATAAVALVGIVGVHGQAGAQPGSTVWLCHPADASDPCDLPSDTTDLRTGAVTAAIPAAENDKPVDCFYVYPTVSNQVALHADPVASPEVESIARYQAARFASTCRVFAPVYRQVPLSTIGAGLTVAPALFDTGYQDVVRAFDEYLAHDNDGRGIVFVSHSQGTMMLRKLLRDRVDSDPDLRGRLVGAFLIGGNVTTAAGATTGGDFANIPLCTQRDQFGCVTAYSTDMTGLPSLFGNSDIDLLSATVGLPHGPAYRVACTDPAILSGDDAPVGVTVPSAPYSFGIISLLMGYTTLPGSLPTSASTWTTSRGRGVGECVFAGGATMYRIRMVEPEPINELPLFGTHLLDINFGYDRLVRIAHQQATAWQSGH